MKAPEIFLNLMRVEMHFDHLTQGGKGRYFPSIVDNILTYTDWTFGQNPESLDERFDKLEKSKRLEPEILKALKKGGEAFESTLKEVLGEDIWQKMTSAGPYQWETEIRKAYCVPSGLTLQETFPSFIFSSFAK